MSDMKCPFCGERLQQTFSFNPPQFWCSNCYDPQHLNHHRQGTKELWQELIRTRKALEIAVDALDRMAIDDNVSGMIARNAIKEIKALEQKE